VVLGAVPCCRGVGRRLDIADALGRVQTRAGAWRFIQVFAAGRATSITGVDGFTGEALDTAEVTLGVRLSAAVRAACRLFGRRTDLTGGIGRLWRPAPIRSRHSRLFEFRRGRNAVAAVTSMACPHEVLSRLVS